MSVKEGERPAVASWRGRRAALGGMLLAALWGCGPGPSSEAERDGLVLQLSGGTYSDGSGRLGLALLATLRDAQGRGPAEAWSGRLSDSGGALTSPFGFEGSAESGAYGAWWWPEVGFAPGETYRLVLERAAGEGVSSSFLGPDSPGLPVAQVSLTEDGTQLTWAPVPGAASYACRVYAAGALQLSASGEAPGCDVSALPAGTYSASVLALTASLEALRADASQRPQLPAAFHVSEGRLAFAKGEGVGATHQAAAVGGALHYGRSQPGLAVWVRLARADGTAFTSAGEVELVGPGLRADAPLRFGYPAGATQHLVWSYDVEPSPGLYTLSARVDGQLLSTQFSIGTPASLPLPTDVAAAPASSGGASVTWAAVPGARAYYVSVWDVQHGTLASSLWTAETGARFGPGTLTAGRTYDVYVAATDVDLASATAPARVTVSENTYLPASFTAQ